jgi:hypothetical protein
LDVPSLPFSFSLEGGLGSLEAFSFLRHNFEFNLEYLFHKLFEEEKKESKMEIL